jgi:hypothetical protein
MALAGCTTFAAILLFSVNRLALASEGDGNMYRVFFVLGGGLMLAACSSTSWNLDVLKPEPITDTVQFESEPPGATATLSIGQNCKTPCSLKVPTNAPFTVTFTLPGYQPDTEQVELVAMGDGTSKLNPNPVVAELTAAPPAVKKPAKKTVKKKTVTTTTTVTTTKKKPAPAPKPASSSSAAPAPAPATASAPPPPAGSPWPSNPPKQ